MIRTSTLLIFAAVGFAQPRLSFVAAQQPGIVYLVVAGGAAISGVQVRLAVPPDAVISAGPALPPSKQVNSSIKDGVAGILIAGVNQAPIGDGAVAQIAFTPAAWAFSAVDPIGVDGQGLAVPGITVAGLAFSPQAPSALVMQRDSWKFAATGYRLSYPVAGGEKNALVYLNGLLMLQGADYQLVGTLLQFSGQPVMSMSNPVVQVVYWH